MSTQLQPTTTTPPVRDPLRTTEQAAARWGVRPKTLEVWRSTRSVDIPFVKIGRLVRYRESVVARVEAEGTSAFT